MLNKQRGESAAGKGHHRQRALKRDAANRPNPL